MPEPKELATLARSPGRRLHHRQRHTPHYSVGYVVNRVNPRLVMATHFSFDLEFLGEATAGIHAIGRPCSPSGSITTSSNSALSVSRVRTGSWPYCGASAGR